MRLEFSEEELEQFEPKIQEAILRLYRQQQPPQAPTEQMGGLRIMEHKTPEDLEREWREKYKDGRFLTTPY